MSNLLKEMGDLQTKSYLLSNKGPHPLMIICPGGGYQHHAAHEADPVALWLNEIGISAIILYYRIAPHQYPAALNDAQTAIQLARFHHQKWNVDPNRVGILGFSAGGHVAACTGVHYKEADPAAKNALDHYSSRPDLMVLNYPVITMGATKYVHEGSKENLLGKQASLSLSQKVSCEKQVNEHTPPTFLWHTADDASVAVQNSLMFASALSKHQIPYDLHVFESGKHGLGLAEEHEEANVWPDLCETWLRKRRFIH